jgi:hypothetical protein
MRKELIFLIFFAFLLIIPVRFAQAQKEIFLRKIDFELTKISPNPYDNEFSLTLQLNKSTKYKFVVTNHINGSIGEAVVHVFDSEAPDKTLVSNIFQTKYFEQFMFLCNKTTFYDITVKFRDNTIGNCQISIFMVQ